MNFKICPNCIDSKTKGSAVPFFQMISLLINYRPITSLICFLCHFLKCQCKYRRNFITCLGMFGLVWTWTVLPLCFWVEEDLTFHCSSRFQKLEGSLKSYQECFKKRIFPSRSIARTFCSSWLTNNLVYPFFAIKD